MYKRQLVGRLAAGVEVKSRHLIVVPPSVHPNGRPYVWSVDGDPEEVALAALPEPWLDRMRQKLRPDGPPSASSDDFLANRSPAEYIALLSGIKVTPGSKISCPFPDHEDRTPSLQVYDGERGWYCFGSVSYTHLTLPTTPYV